MHLFKQEKRLQKTSVVFVLMVGLILGSPRSSSAQNKMTLKDCINAALGHDPQVELAQMETAAAESEVKAAQAALFPSVKGALKGELFNGSSLQPFALENAADADTLGVGNKNRVVNFGHIWRGEL